MALVVVMALSMMVMSSSALTDGKTFGFVVKADKTEKEIVPGAKVTVTIALDMSDYNQLMSDMRLAILLITRFIRLTLQLVRFMVTGLNMQKRQQNRQLTRHLLH